LQRCRMRQEMAKTEEELVRVSSEYFKKGDSVMLEDVKYMKACMSMTPANHQSAIAQQLNLTRRRNICLPDGDRHR